MEGKSCDHKNSSRGNYKILEKIRIYKSRQPNHQKKENIGFPMIFNQLSHLF